MYDYHILVVDDNIPLLQSLKLILKDSFRKVAAVSNPQLLPAILSRGSVDAVLLDMNFDSKRLDGSEGLFWLRRIKEGEKAPAVLLMTAFADIPLAVESMKAGADEFITKPWNNEDLLNKLLTAIQKKNGDSGGKGVCTEAEPSREETPSDITLEQMERKKIELVLKECKRNMTLASMRLGISRRTLYNKIEKYGL